MPTQVRRSPCFAAIAFSIVAAASACRSKPNAPESKEPTYDLSRAPARDSGSGPVSSNLYAATAVGMLAPAAARAETLVYVPNSRSNSVTIIDPRTKHVVRTFRTGALPQHVVPAYDLGRLWVTNDKGNSLTPVDPVTGRESTFVKVDDPYNLYFTPDGAMAMVIAEKRHRFDFRDPHTMQLRKSVQVDCGGLDHVDFTADGRYAIATCEFSGQIVKLDLQTQAPVSYLKLAARPGTTAMPQDIRASPDGRVFFVADMKADGVHLIDPYAMRQIGFLATGKGAHGLVVDRAGKRLYVMNRGWNTIFGGQHGPGSISVIDPATDSILATWPIPRGGSPDMGNISSDGRELWVSGRYDREVYVFDTSTGKLVARIPVGDEPHGLCYWPQPGRYSLGHTGNMR